MSALLATACSTGSTSEAPDGGAGELDSGVDDGGVSLPTALDSPLESMSDAAERLSDCGHYDTVEVDLDERIEGVSAESILAFAEGTFRETLNWRDLPELMLNKSGESALYVTVERGEHANVISPLPENMSAACRRWLTIDVHVTLQSEDGALNDAFEGQLWVERSDMVFLTARTTGSELAGDLTAQPSDTSVVSHWFGIALNFTEHGVSGALDIGLNIEDVVDGEIVGSGFQRWGIAYLGAADCFGRIAGGSARRARPGHAR